MWRPVCIDSSDDVDRRPWLLASPGMILALAGCDSTAASGSTGANPSSTEAGSGLAGRTGPTGKTSPVQASSTGKSQAKVVSTDRRATA